MNIIEYENYHEKKEHGELDFPYITYPCSIPLDFPKVPLHWHDEMEIIYIKKGQGVVMIDFCLYHVSGGDILIILPGKLHSIGQQKGCSMEYENIIFQPSMLMPGQADLCTTSYFQPLFQNQRDFLEYLPPSHPAYPEAARCLDQADFLCQHKPAAYQISVKAQLLQFFYVLFSFLEEHGKHEEPAPATKDPRNQRSKEKTKLILKYIETHYAKPLTIEEMAGVCGFSQSHFMKFFKATFHKPFVAYLREYRLTMASRLLLTSNAAILEIAQDTGFENLSYFNRSFKAMFGKTPREFREGGRD